MDDFVLAKRHFPEDTDIKMTMETLQLCQKAINSDVNELPSQILGRVTEVSWPVLFIRASWCHCKVYAQSIQYIEIIDISLYICVTQIHRKSIINHVIVLLFYL